jgi:hypothetical protein
LKEGKDSLKNLPMLPVGITTYLKRLMVCAKYITEMITPTMPARENLQFLARKYAVCALKQIRIRKILLNSVGLPKAEVTDFQLYKIFAAA